MAAIDFTIDCLIYDIVRYRSVHIVFVHSFAVEQMVVLVFVYTLCVVEEIFALVHFLRLPCLPVGRVDVVAGGRLPFTLVDIGEPYQRADERPVAARVLAHIPRSPGDSSIFLAVLVDMTVISIDAVLCKIFRFLEIFLIPCRLVCDEEVSDEPHLVIIYVQRPADIVCPRSRCPRNPVYGPGLLSLCIGCQAEGPFVEGQSVVQLVQEFRIPFEMLVIECAVAGLFLEVQRIENIGYCLECGRAFVCILLSAVGQLSGVRVVFLVQTEVAGQVGGSGCISYLHRPFEISRGKVCCPLLPVVSAGTLVAGYSAYGKGHGGDEKTYRKTDSSHRFNVSSVQHYRSISCSRHCSPLP